MKRKTFSPACIGAGVAFAMFLTLGGRAWASSETVLYTFQQGGNGGNYPEGGLIFDSDGNLYGTTCCGGAYDAGTVFELKDSSGGWTETVLYSFTGGSDGGSPAAHLIFDKAGTLYGTTSGGGGGGCQGGCGVVFKLTKSGGKWKESVLHVFHNNGKDGFDPLAPLVFDASGNLYGTTTGGGSYEFGTVFELVPGSGGVWKEKLIHTFTGYEDGASPLGALIFDPQGDLYGTASSGGLGRGTVFELVHKKKGWSEIVLHAFPLNQGPDGQTPTAGVIADTAGNLYGTTATGGSYSLGTVFELEKTKSGWTEGVLYSFCPGQSQCTDGSGPVEDGVTLDSSGNLYGMTCCGGLDYGVVFELTFSGGNWQETVLYSFTGGSDGEYPTDEGNLVFDNEGNLYGEAGGGTGGVGVVFDVTP